ncbi:hypothetical protein OG883_13495 [Streptomyces sp. NBC_01142]|nr:hypothetical protein [Streptomyces sp. NBC_01142]MCX4820904.1 hypothetical protein [Streptomyces sp. NBC_01142]
MTTAGKDSGTAATARLIAVTVIVAGPARVLAQRHPWQVLHAAVADD